MPSITPFRYPGAKPKLLTHILDRIPSSEEPYIEPFVGGGSVALSVAERDPKRILFLSDADLRVAQFWRVVSSGEGLPDLIGRMRRRPTIDLWTRLRKETDDPVTLAYQAILFNRTCYNGILDSGPIGGFDQSGEYSVDCRYNPDKLITKTVACHNLLRTRTRAIHAPFETSFPNVTGFTYLDPPYFHQGASLYNETCDHKRLRAWLGARPPWLLSYDDCQEIRSMYSGCTIETITARYCLKNNWRTRTELLISP